MEELPNEGKRGLEEFEQGRTSSRRNSPGPNSKSKDTISKSGNLGGGGGTTILTPYIGSLDPPMRQS